MPLVYVAEGIKIHRQFEVKGRLLRLTAAALAALRNKGLAIHTLDWTGPALAALQTALHVEADGTLVEEPCAPRLPPSPSSPTPQAQAARTPSAEVESVDFSSSDTEPATFEDAAVGNAGGDAGVEDGQAEDAPSASAERVHSPSSGTASSSSVSNSPSPSEEEAEEEDIDLATVEWVLPQSTGARLHRMHETLLSGEGWPRARCSATAGEPLWGTGLAAARKAAPSAAWCRRCAADLLAAVAARAPP